MESLVSCLGAGGGEDDQAGQQGGGGGGEVEKLAQQIATLEVGHLFTCQLKITWNNAISHQHDLLTPDNPQVRELNQRQRADFLEGQAKLIQVLHTCQFSI